MKKIVLYLIKMTKPENPGERWPDMELRMDVSVDGRNCTETFQRLVTTRMDTPWWSFGAFLDRGAVKFREALFQLGIVLNKREVRKWLASFESDDSPDIYTHKDVQVSIAREGGA